MLDADRCRRARQGLRSAGANSLDKGRSVPLGVYADASVAVANAGRPEENREEGG